jgi:CBS domain-containing protein
MVYKVKDFMNKSISSIDAEDSVYEASKMMTEDKRGYLIVLKRDQILGIVTEKDLVRKVMASGGDPSKVRISEVMSTPLIVVDPDETIENAVKILAENKIRRLPVMKTGILYGIFGDRELAEHFSEYGDSITRDMIKYMTVYSC